MIMVGHGAVQEPTPLKSLILLATLWLRGPVFSSFRSFSRFGGCIERRGAEAAPKEAIWQNDRIHAIALDLQPAPRAPRPGIARIFEAPAIEFKDPEMTVEIPKAELLALTADTRPVWIAS